MAPIAVEAVKSQMSGPMKRDSF
ncbi:hypothetical protein CCACVL1_15240 [Corchorus capsularis]|uniref:Uncharacterized protein n=1 Tax=Corchorus capsularis TaxID=210143 RepID=A0A1R3I338_COCAP|nr:hypothetical protein CCACVL1_15240 [Corchorus capsularis]